MGIFNFLFGRKPQSAASDLPLKREDSFTHSRDGADHLGRAITARDKAKRAVAKADYETAWRYFHEQKEHYFRHANRYGMTARQALALDGSVHEDLANILRLEGKLDDALTHLLYCVISNPRVTKAQSKKIVTYFNRCGFKNVKAPELEAFLAAPWPKPDFGCARDRVLMWRNK